MAHADVGVIALAMIETRDALDQLETILDVDGLDGVYVGPNDLSLSLRGRGGIDHTDEDMLEVLRQIAQAARARGKVAGIFTGTPAYAQQMADLGYRFLTVSSDSRLLRDAAAASLAALRASDAPSSAVNVTPQSGY
jgi:4-hydroxy-2-oxoheptanedioate aldolase